MTTDRTTDVTDHSSTRARTHSYDYAMCMRTRIVTLALHFRRADTSRSARHAAREKKREKSCDPAKEGRDACGERDAEDEGTSVERGRKSDDEEREKERESETLDARKVANLGESCENFSCDKFARAAR